MNLLLISNDLLVQSRVSAAALQASLSPPRVFHSAEAVSSKDAADRCIVILDLSTPGIDVPRAVSMLREALPPNTPILSFAPHVHTARLAAARDAGCDQVLTRGQFDREIETVLRQAAAG